MSIEPVKVLDLLFSRYGSGAASILQMQYEEGMEIIKFAERQKAEETIYQRWLLGYEKFMSLDEFKEKLSVNTTLASKNETKEEILDKVKTILEK